MVYTDFLSSVMVSGSVTNCTASSTETFTTESDRLPNAILSLGGLNFCTVVVTGLVAGFGFCAIAVFATTTRQNNTTVFLSAGIAFFLVQRIYGVNSIAAGILTKSFLSGFKGFLFEIEWLMA
jgi:hypothetical protein